MILSQISGMALLIWESNDIAEDKSSSSYPKIRWPLDLICPSMFILLKMNQWCQRSMLFSDGKFSESISSGPTISSTPRKSFLQDNVYMEQRYREASGRSFYIDYKFRIEIIFVFQSHWYFIIQFTHSFSKIKFILLCLFNEFKSFSIYSHVSLYDPSTATDSSEINWINSSDFPSYFSWAGSWQWQLQKDHG